ncbi:MAG: hypothetical protein RIC56_06025 [Pseudomonadales bacterium]
MIQAQPKADWSPVPRPGTSGVAFRILLRGDGILLASLRLGRSATIDRHSAPHEIDVVCIAGGGFTSIGDEKYAIHEGQTVRWPANVDHCLWTTDSSMETLMVERYGAQR